MGVRDNLKKLMEYQYKKGKESSVERNVIKNSVEENVFYAEYSSFTAGLQEMLDRLLGDGMHKEVTYEPKKPSDAKFFMAVMEDDQFKPYYDITKTVGGEFTFKLKDFKNSLFDSLSDEGIEDYEDVDSGILFDAGEDEEEQSRGY